MSAVLGDVRAIWRATTVQRDPRTVRFVHLAAPGGLIMAVAALAWMLVRHDITLAQVPGALAGVVAAIAALWLFVLWGLLFMPASIVLNSAANARLLPRQRRALVLLAAGGWLLVTAGFAVVFGSWKAVPLIGLYVTGFTLARLGYSMAMLLLPVAGLWPALSRGGMVPASLVAAGTSEAGVLAACAVMLLGLAGVLARLYPAGGDAHLDRRAGMLRRMARVGGINAPAGAGSVAGMRGPLGYAAALRRACRRPEPGNMLIHALGPVAHWTAWVPAIGGILAAAVLVRLALARSGNGFLHDFIDHSLFSGLGSMAVMVLFSTAQYRHQMQRTRGEQALLRLTPLAGATAWLNRRLATQLLRRALAGWAALTLVVLAVSALVGADGAALLRQFALCCLAGQAAMSGVLDDHARVNSAFNILTWRGGAVVVAEVAVIVVLGLVTGTSVWPWMIAVGLAGAAVVLRRGWRRMLAAPPAFPAGRLA